MSISVVYDILGDKRILLMKEVIENAKSYLYFYNCDGSVKHKYLKDAEGKNLIYDKDNKLLFTVINQFPSETWYDSEGKVIHFTEIKNGMLFETHYIHDKKVYHREESLEGLRNAEIEFIDYHYTFDPKDPQTFITRAFNVKEYDNKREFTSGFDKWIFTKYENITIWEKHMNGVKYAAWEIGRE